MGSPTQRVASAFTYILGWLWTRRCTPPQRLTGPRCFVFCSSTIQVLLRSGTCSQRLTFCHLCPPPSQRRSILASPSHLCREFPGRWYPSGIATPVLQRSNDFGWVCWRTSLTFPQHRRYLVSYTWLDTSDCLPLTGIMADRELPHSQTL